MRQAHQLRGRGPGAQVRPETVRGGGIVLWQMQLSQASPHWSGSRRQALQENSQSQNLSMSQTRPYSCYYKTNANTTIQYEVLKYCKKHISGHYPKA